MTSRALLWFAVCATSIGCTSGLDAGADAPHGLLPVDERNPVMLLNDGAYDNWQGEYAILLANTGGPPIAGIAVSTGGIWSDLDANVGGWRNLVSAARASGLADIPDPIASISPPLRKPGNGNIDATLSNRSEGANAIVEISSRVSRSYRPMVVVTGGKLTDVADAYLMDPTVVDRVVVVSSLGTITSGGAAMGVPNGEMDPWADTIVLTRFRYVQVSSYYDQTTDVPASLLPDLPANPFGDWIRAKSSQIMNNLLAADQVAVIALGLPAFVTRVEHVAQDTPTDAAPTDWPLLRADSAGRALLVTGSSGALATARFWQSLLDPATYHK